MVGLFWGAKNKYSKTVYQTMFDKHGAKKMCRGVEELRGVKP
jgi:hypothetical protein